jgi:hypothetical protein
MSRSPDTIAQFYRLIDQARPPQRADRSAARTLPARAYRYCEAVTSATAFGWWAFPPTDIMRQRNGTDIFWQCEGVSDSLPLMPSAQFPGFAERFNAAAPLALQNRSPQFLTALPEPGLLLMHPLILPLGGRWNERILGGCGVSEKNRAYGNPAMILLFRPTASRSATL